MKQKRLMFIFSFIIVLIIFYLAISNSASHSGPKQVKVGVIDTSLSNEYVSQYNISNIMIDNTALDDDDTHANMVVDVIKNRDNNCEIYIANVLSEDNTGNISDIVNALIWLKDKEVDIICMSFTTFEDDEVLRETISAIQSRGVYIIASCLNYSNVATYPACYDNVISVANCRHEEASISITNKAIKDELKNTKWNECSTSILTAYIAGEISKDMSDGKFNLNKFIQNII